MHRAILITFLIGFTLRLLSLGISIRNENRLKSKGAIEHGRRTTLALAILHTLFFFAALTEGLLKATPWTTLSTAGLAIYTFSLLALFYVIYELSPVWTIKLIIAKDHPLVTSPLFKHLRHPNYFLNVLPELIGLTLLAQSWFTAIILLPPYLYCLFIRIRQEEKVMRQACPDY